MRTTDKIKVAIVVLGFPLLLVIMVLIIKSTPKANKECQPATVVEVVHVACKYQGICEYYIRVEDETELWTNWRVAKGDKICI